MAFGSALGRADGATVVLNADTGQFNAKIEAAERQWRESTGAMTREALKLDVAQDRLRKSLSRYGAEATQTKRATISLKDAQEQASRAADRQTREMKELDRATRSTSSGMKQLRNFAGTLAAGVGIYGLAGALRASVTAAKEEELVLGQTMIAVKAAGLEWDRYVDRINSVIRVQSQLGFDDEKLMQTFSLFVRRTKDVNAALKLNELAVDVARGRYIDLEQASLLVLKASLGQAGALRRVGIDAKAGASSVELLTLLTKSYGGAAAEASQTATGASDRLVVEWENMKEVLGRGLLPAVTDVADRLAKFFGDSENQRVVQEKMNSAIETGEKVVRGFAGGLQLVKKFADPVVGALGGMERAIQSLTLLWVGFKVKAALGFSQTALSSGAASRAMIVHASAAGRAWDIATRPRNLVVTTTTTGVPVGGGSRGVPPVVPVPPDPRTRRRGGGLVGTAIAIITAIVGPEILERAPNDRGQAGPNEMAKLRAWARAGRLTQEHVDQLANFLLNDAQERELRGIIIGRPTRRGAAGPGAGIGADIARRDREKAKPPRTGGGAPSRPRTLADIELDIARPGNDVGDLQEKRSFIGRQIAFLERRKKLYPAQKAKLAALYGELSNVQSELDGIAAAGEEKIANQQATAAANRAAAQAAAAANLAAAQAAAEKKEAAMDRWYGDRDRPHRVAAHRPLRESGGRGVKGVGTRPEKGRGGKEAAEEKGMTEADFRRMSFEFLSSLHGIVGQFGGNTNEGAMGQVATHAVAQTSLIRDQNKMIGQLVGGMWHPGAAYAGTQLSATGIGAGY